jgi:hypothetical protein
MLMHNKVDELLSHIRKEHETSRQQSKIYEDVANQQHGVRIFSPSEVQRLAQYILSDLEDDLKKGDMPIAKFTGLDCIASL